MPKIYGSSEIWGDLLVTGSFSILGSASSIYTTSLVVSDTIISLGHSQSGTPLLDEGIMFTRGTGLTQAFIWDETNDTFALIGTNDDHTVIGSVNIDSYSNLRVGGLTTSNIKITDSATSGYVLTSDSLGNATWQAPLSASPSLSQVLATGNTSGSNNILISSGNYVGWQYGSFVGRIIINNSGFTTNRSFMLPDDTGTLVLGSGSTNYITKWLSSSGLTNSIIYDDGSKVGISTTSPNATLDVRGSAIFNENGDDFDFRIEGDSDANLFFLDAGLNSIGIGVTPDSTSKFRVSSTLTNQLYALVVQNTSHNGTYAYGIESISNSSSAQYNIGIQGSADSSTVENWGVRGLAGGSTTDNKAFLGEVVTPNTATNYAAYLDAINTGSGTEYALYTHRGGALFNGIGGDYDFKIQGDSDSNLFFADASTDSIGIGTNTPLYKVQVSGTVSTTGFRMTSGATNGYVLTSDASGNATWQAPSGGSGLAGSGSASYIPKWSSSTGLTNSLIYDNGSTIFIGQTTSSTDTLLYLREFNSSIRTGIYTEVSSSTSFNVGISSNVGSGIGFGSGDYAIVGNIGASTASDSYSIYARNNGSSTNKYASYNIVTGNGISTTNYGSYNLVSGANTNNFGIYNVISGTYGNKYGMYTVMTGQGDNYGQYTALSSTGSSNYGLFISSSGATNNWGVFVQNGTSVFNNSGNANSDFRIAGEFESNLFFADASTNRIGVKTSLPTYDFTVSGTVSSTGLYNDGGLRNKVTDPVSNPYTITTNDYILRGQPSGGYFTFSLPTTPPIGTEIIITKQQGGTVSIVSTGDTMAGGNSGGLTTINWNPGTYGISKFIYMGGFWITDSI